MMNTQLKVLTLLGSMAFATFSWADNATSANVMAPLQVSNWSEFATQLSTAKSIGVTAVSVDVWWGKVEASADQVFDWSYYDTVFQYITNAGLDIVPIMSFHQCGGNVGDECNIPIPTWIWSHYSSEGVSASDLRYKSEYGNESVETVSLWMDDYVLDEYKEFMEAFESQYASLAGDIDELNISMGPAGELRYPSYNSHDGGLTGYPTRGGLQSYSDPAVADFQAWMLTEYGSLSGVNSAWGTALSSSSEITPPSDAGSFFSAGDQYNTQYGRDFIRWYHDALMDHGHRMMDNALSAFDGAFADIALGFKIPGVHWKMAATDNTVRSAEMAAGLIPSDIDLSADSTGHGYQDIIAVAASYSGESRGVVLHFTCLEMDDDASGSGQSLAKSLVFWVANEAEAQSVTIKGENALSGGVTYGSGWDNIENAFTWASYSGLAVLRISQVTDGGTGQSRYQSFISNYLVTDDGDWQRTVVFIYGVTQYGQDMFIRGGIDHSYANTYLGKSCSSANYECAIPIRHDTDRNTTTATWKEGDNYLDWYGAEASQNSAAVGTPLDWTTNNASYTYTVAVDGYGYEPLNSYGEHYWMMDVDMDCSKTVDGWFELKSYISNGAGWESDVSQSGTPYASGNHFAQCGKLNVFQRDASAATIGDL